MKIALSQAKPRPFPDGTIHLAIAEGAESALPRPLLYVTGTDRDAIAARHLSLHRFVPDLGLRFVTNATVYGDLFVETRGRLLGEPSVMLPYVKGQIESGAIDVPHQRAMRQSSLQVEGPTAFFGSVSPRVFGHWLVDIWPRAWLLSTAVGPGLDSYKVLLPDSSPGWALDALFEFFGFSAENVVLYSETSQKVETDLCLVPTYLHNNFAFHPHFLQFAAFMKRAVNSDMSPAPRRIYVSRRGFRAHSHSYKRSIANEDAVEALFLKKGFTMVAPETLPLREQIALFRGAKIIAGEAGSALHNSIFADSGATVISLNFNEIQTGICSLVGQELIYMLPSEQKVHTGGDLQMEFNIVDLSNAIDVALQRG